MAAGVEAGFDAHSSEALPRHLPLRCNPFAGGGRCGTPLGTIGAEPASGMIEVGGPPSFLGCSSQETEALALSRAVSDEERIALSAVWVQMEFDAYYRDARAIPDLAKAAFEERDYASSVALSRRRLDAYRLSINAFGPRLSGVWPALAADERLWGAMEVRYLPLIEASYEADLALAYMHSVRRQVYRGEWQPVDYVFRERSAEAAFQIDRIYVEFPIEAQAWPVSVAPILDLPRFRTPWRDRRDDAALIARRLALDLEGTEVPVRIEMIDAGFFRNRGAYLVGRACLSGGGWLPFVLALVNDDDGIHVDALLTRESDVHNLFSSTLANFHVTSPHYHELSAFLRSIMPGRPLGLHYSTIGFNHVGKVALMTELRDELNDSGERLAISAGFPGTVAIGFSGPSSAYNLKVIRDYPTRGYKWGDFEGIESVRRKYSRVHQMNRTGSMLDNIIYYNLRLDGDWFEPELLDELCSQAGESVSRVGDSVVFEHLIVQRRTVPLHLYLEGAAPEEVERAIVNLGYCIKNNAAANIFNKDLDARNYGVSPYGKVYLYDYDALEPFTDVKIRSNVNRIDGEEDIPDWYFEDGVVFLPEEMITGLRIRRHSFHELFGAIHGDLLTTAYWEHIQQDLLAGYVPGIRVYPEERKLRRDNGGE